MFAYLFSNKETLAFVVRFQDLLIVPKLCGKIGGKEFLSELFLDEKKSTNQQIRLQIHLIPKAWSEHGVEALWTGQKNLHVQC